MARGRSTRTGSSPRSTSRHSNLDPELASALERTGVASQLEVFMGRGSDSQTVFIAFPFNLGNAVALGSRDETLARLADMPAGLAEASQRSMAGDIWISEDLSADLERVVPGARLASYEFGWEGFLTLLDPAGAPEPGVFGGNNSVRDLAELRMILSELPDGAGMPTLTAAVRITRRSFDRGYEQSREDDLPPPGY